MRACLVCNNSIEHRIASAKFCSIECKDVKWKTDNWDRVLATATKHRQTEKCKLNRSIRRHAINAQSKEWRLKNKDRKQAIDRAYHQSKQGDPDYLAKRRHHEAMRRARKVQATPKWLTQEHLERIKEIYRDCPETYHVDHIVPLKGKNVSGLHAPWNLQCLPGIVNRVKHNKVDNGDSD